MNKAAKAIRKKKRKTPERFAKPKLTPTHFIRLARPQVVIDGSKRWFVVRVVGRRDSRAEKSLKEASIPHYVPVDVETVIRRGRRAEVKARPLTGYAFVGLDDRSAEAVSDVLAVEEVAYFLGGSECPPEVSQRQLQAFASKMTPPTGSVLCDASGAILQWFDEMIPEAEFVPVEMALADQIGS